MKKYEKPSEDLVELFNSVLSETLIPDWIDFEIRVDNKQKKVISKIRKLDDLVVNLTDQINFAIVVNERAFYHYSDEQKRMELRDQIEGVVTDENDKISLVKPSFSAHIGLLDKYGYDAIKGLYETREAIFIKLKEEDDAIKAQTKGKRGRKRKNSTNISDVE